MLVGGFAHQLKAFLPHALKRIRRGTRFESAAAKYAGPGFGHLLRHQENLLARFNGTRPRHHNHFLAPDLNIVGQAHNRTFRAE